MGFVALNAAHVSMKGQNAEKKSIITVLIWTYCRKALHDYIFSRQTTAISTSLLQQCTLRVKAR